jgi:hypothetical protein
MNEKKSTVITFNTTETVDKRIANIRKTMPFSTRSSLLHQLLDDLTTKIEQGEFVIQQVPSMGSMDAVTIQIQAGGQS